MTHCHLKQPVPAVLILRPTMHRSTSLQRNQPTICDAEYYYSYYRRYYSYVDLTVYIVGKLSDCSVCRSLSELPRRHNGADGVVAARRDTFSFSAFSDRPAWRPCSARCTLIGPNSTNQRLTSARPTSSLASDGLSILATVCKLKFGGP